LITRAFGKIGGAVADTLPYVGRTVRVAGIFFNYNNWPDAEAGYIIHEASHKCGTTDLADFNHNKNTYPQDTFFAYWSNIGSAYSYWALFGFCIPNVNCPLHP
jgi:hypothetical protein